MVAVCSTQTEKLLKSNLNECVSLLAKMTRVEVNNGVVLVLKKKLKNEVESLPAQTTKLVRTLIVIMGLWGSTLK